MPYNPILGRQWGDPNHPGYAAWHAEHVDGPVRAKQRADQVGVARHELAKARFASQMGDRPAAARALQRAGRERSIAAKMPRM